MPHVNLNDESYQVACRRAAEGGFASAEEYVVHLLQRGLLEDNLDCMFTPEQLAHIEKAEASIAGGQRLTSEQADAELAKRRNEWFRRNK